MVRSAHEDAIEREDAAQPEVREPLGFEELLATVSHDLKSPLSAIMMTAATLLSADAGERTSQVRRKAETIKRSAERIAGMIDDMVDFAHMQSGRFAIARRPESAAALVESSLHSFADVAHGRAIELRAHAAANLPAIACDRERITQVLSKLLTNALKVTEAGGVVSIGAEHSGDDVLFFVEDGGPGIRADELPNIFDRSWRSRDAGYGSVGLGLTVAKGVVDAHHGRIWAESKIGTGTRFSFTVPIASAVE
jgi:signal transduction histidine kinase